MRASLHLHVAVGGSPPPGTLPGGVLFPLRTASLCFSSNAPFKSAGNLTNEQRSEQRGCLYCTTHPVPSTSPCPAVVHLSLLTPCPYRKPARAHLKVKPAQHRFNTYLLMHVHGDMSKRVNEVVHVALCCNYYQVA